MCVHMNAKLRVCLCMCAHMYVQAYAWFISLYPECAPSGPLLHLPLKLMPELGKCWQWENKAAWLLGPVFCKLLCQEQPELRLIWKV